ncbi:MAG: hypothetical protein ABEH88_01775 [Halobacteriales archaeon]
MSEPSGTNGDDHTLLALVYGSALFFMLCWRVGVLINDSYVFANTLIALRNGHLQITELVYRASQPGLYISDGAIYGRNYGLAFLALPVLLGVQGISQVIDPQIVIVGTWSVLLGLFVDECRQAAGWSRTVTYAGSGIAVVFFGLNLWLLQPIPRNWHPHMALQVTSICFATATVALVYKLGLAVASRRVGIFVGGLAAVASPMAFWATLSKRHTVIGFLALAVLYGLYQSRTADSPRDALRYRVLAYGCVGLAAWINSIEGLLLALALVPLDLLTARTRLVRSIGISGSALTVAFLPFFLTNFLISGNPLRPPMALSNPTRSELTAAFGSDGTTDDATGPDGGTNGTIGEGAARTDGEAAGGLIDALAAGAGNRAERFLSALTGNVDSLTQLERWYTVFVRSSTGMFSSGQFDVPARDFAMLESLPVLGVLVAVVVLGIRHVSLADWRLRETVLESPRRFRRNPRRVADAFVVLYTAWLLVIYLPRLPLHVTYNVRYLYPMYPLGLYAIARLAIVQRTVEVAWRRLLASYAAAVIVGGVGMLLVLGFVTANPSGFSRHMDAYTDVFKIHAIAGAAIGVLVAAWSGYAAYTGDGEQVGATWLGIAAGVTTVFLVLVALRYFAFTSQYAVPISRAVARLLGAA